MFLFAQVTNKQRKLNSENKNNPFPWFLVWISNSVTESGKWNTYRLWWLENWGHSYGLLKEQVIGMHFLMIKRENTETDLNETDTVGKMRNVNDEKLYDQK